MGAGSAETLRDFGAGADGADTDTGGSKSSVAIIKRYDLNCGLAGSGLASEELQRDSERWTENHARREA